MFQSRGFFTNIFRSSSFPFAHSPQILSVLFSCERARSFAQNYHHILTEVFDDDFCIGLVYVYVELLTVD